MALPLTPTSCMKQDPNGGAAKPAKRPRPAPGALEDGGHSDEAACIDRQLETGVKVQVLVDQLHELKLAPRRLQAPHALDLVGLGGLGGKEREMALRKFRNIKPRIKKEMAPTPPQSGASPGADPAPSPPAHTAQLPGAAQFSPPAGFAVVSKKDVQELERLRKRNVKVKKGNKKVGRQHNDTVARLEKERDAAQAAATAANKEARDLRALRRRG